MGRVHNERRAGRNCEAGAREIPTRRQPVTKSATAAFTLRSQADILIAPEPRA
jgi:hypothetical protein